MEDVSPTMMRDFFWDNDFRQVWDDMLVQTKTLEECKETGSEILHWVRKVCCWSCHLPLIFTYFLYPLQEVLILM
jgi:hypothetical protein